MIKTLEDSQKFKERILQEMFISNKELEPSEKTEQGGEGEWIK